MEQLDRVFGREEAGLRYARYDNPTAAALEELVTALEGGHGAAGVQLRDGRHACGDYWPR